jgi:geranylgeranyl pyrophosphate synthase
MREAVWPSSSEVHAAVALRVKQLLDEHAGPVAEIGAGVLASGHGILSPEPHSLTTVLVVGACIAAGADWRAALWPAAAAECMMVAADLFDDLADADSDAGRHSPGTTLTAAAGLLSLATVAATRVAEDGASPATAVALATILGSSFADAANGQARNLLPRDSAMDALAAYNQAAAKSGPLGALIARLGARTATDHEEITALLAEFGRRLAVRSQLLNDARDAAPSPGTWKADVRDGARTVPLVFAGSYGAPAGLTEPELARWESAERDRISAAGGLAAAHALAEAERLRALRALDELARRGCPVAGLVKLV